MQSGSWRSVLLLVSVVSMLAGCGPGAGDASKERLTSMAGGALKEVVPVSGKVLVDGEAKGGVNLYLHREEGGEPLADCRTNPDGTYCWATYVPCDGIAPGEYRVSFRYIPKVKRNENDGVSNDQFKGKYADPKKSDFKLSVAKDAPMKDVNYELKMK